MLEVVITVSILIIFCVIICVKTKKNTELNVECLNVKFNFIAKNEKNSGCHQSFDKK